MRTGRSKEEQPSWVPRSPRRRVPASPRPGGSASLWFLALLLAVPTLSGCGTSVVRKGVQRRIQKRLVQIVGPADSYRVRIRDTSDAQLVLGRARRVEIEGRGVHAKGQMLIDLIRCTLVDLEYEGGEPYFVTIRRSDLEVEFTDRALNQYLKAYHARFEPEIRFEPDQVHVKMLYPFLGTPTTITATGRFVVREGRQLIFDAERADVSFIDSPGFGERFVEDRVNPVLDLSRIDFPARLESVQVLQGRLRAHGTAALDSEPPDD